MLVREVMSNGCITVTLGTPVKTALARLSSAGITAMPVVSHSGRLRGIVSEADLIRESVASDLRLHEIPHPASLPDRPAFVDDVMTPHVLTVDPDTDLAEAVELMTSTGVKSLPVVDRHDRVLGMVSRSDVVHMLARADHELERDVDVALAAAGLRDWQVEVADGTARLVPPRHGPDDRGLARIAAATVPGVVEVHILTAD
jgi:CBS domain-containing protein